MRYLAIPSLVLAILTICPASVSAQTAPQATPQFSEFPFVFRDESILALPQLIPPRRPTPWRFYASAFWPPRTPHDLAMREAVRAFGANRHSFVRVEIRDGRVFTGGIIRIDEDWFELSHGIMDSEEIRYSSLKQAPQLDPAPGEHLLNGVRWAGTAAGYTVAVPLGIALIPLWMTGALGPD